MRCRTCSQVPAISSRAWCGAGPGASSQRLPALQGRGLSNKERGSAPLPFTSTRGLPVCPPMLSWKSQLRPGLPACRCRAVPALLKHCGSGWLQAPGDRERGQWQGGLCSHLAPSSDCPQEFSKEQTCLSLQLGYLGVCSTPEAKLARPAAQVGGGQDKLWLTVLSNLELVAWKNEGPR